MPLSDAIAEVAVDAIAAACGVARRIQQRSGGPLAVTKPDASPVTVADFAVQAILILALEESGAADAPLLVAGEESAATLRERSHAPLLDAVVTAVQAWRKDLTAERILAAIDAGAHDARADVFWTIDPIDGTKGFVRGGQYAVRLARLEQGEIVFGALGCPNLPADVHAPVDEHPSSGTLFVAGRGAGTWQRAECAPRERGVRLRVADALDRPPILAASHTSTPSPTGFLSRVLARLGPGATRIRLDSQCKYAVVARGQADGYARGPRDDAGEFIWDHAPGTIVATEAGAVVTDIDGRPMDFNHGRRLSANRGVLCATPGLHPRLLEAVHAERAAR